MFTLPKATFPVVVKEPAAVNVNVFAFVTVTVKVPSTALPETKSNCTESLLDNP